MRTSEFLGPGSRLLDLLGFFYFSVPCGGSWVLRFWILEFRILEVFGLFTYLVVLEFRIRSFGAYFGLIYLAS